MEFDFVSPFSWCCVSTVWRSNVSAGHCVTSTFISHLSFFGGCLVKLCFGGCFSSNTWTLWNSKSNVSWKMHFSTLALSPPLPIPNSPQLQLLMAAELQVLMELLSKNHKGRKHPKGETFFCHWIYVWKQHSVWRLPCPPISCSAWLCVFNEV